MSLLERLIVGAVSKPVKQCAHLDSRFCPLRQQVNQGVGDGVIAEIEVFQMNAFLGLTDGLEQVVKFLLAVHQQCDRVVV